MLWSLLGARGCKISLCQQQQQLHAMVDRGTDERTETVVENEGVQKKVCLVDHYLKSGSVSCKSQLSCHLQQNVEGIYR